MAHQLTHWPSNPHCDSCQIAKAQTNLARRRLGLGPKLDGLVDVSYDHIIAASLESQCLGVDRDALVIMDRGMRHIECHSSRLVVRLALGYKRRDAQAGMSTRALQRAIPRGRGATEGPVARKAFPVWRLCALHVEAA